MHLQAKQGAATKLRQSYSGEYTQLLKLKKQASQASSDDEEITMQVMLHRAPFNHGGGNHEVEHRKLLSDYALALLPELHHSLAEGLVDHRIPL